jgi:hypothetical protein
LEDIMRKHSFNMGQLVATPGALDLLAYHARRIEEFLSRHASGDWGDLDAEDWNANDEALARGEGRLFSSYQIGEQKLWIITESDRSSTCALLPTDY